MSLGGILSAPFQSSVAAVVDIVVVAVGVASGAAAATSGADILYKPPSTQNKEPLSKHLYNPKTPMSHKKERYTIHERSARDLTGGPCGVQPLGYFQLGFSLRRIKHKHNADELIELAGSYAGRCSNTLDTSAQREGTLSALGLAASKILKRNLRGVEALKESRGGFGERSLLCLPGRQR